MYKYKKTISIVVTLSDPSMEHITAVSRVHNRGINLNRLYNAVKLIDDYCDNKMDLEELFHAMKKLKEYNQYKNIIKNISLILIPSFFTIMLNGKFIDAIAATLCGIILLILNFFLKYIRTNTFIINLFKIFMMTITAGLLNKLIDSSVENVMIGVIMLFVPGILPIVPGLAIYKTVYYILYNNVSDIKYYLWQSVLIAGGISFIVFL